jgi:hypothetical protein
MRDSSVVHVAGTTLVNRQMGREAKDAEDWEGLLLGWCMCVCVVTPRCIGGGDAQDAYAWKEAHEAAGSRVS